MISSEKRDRCIITVENAAASSMQKSRSDTPSSEFSDGPAKPSAAAVIARSIG